jgi:hypothetical protein
MSGFFEKKRNHLTNESNHLSNDRDNK